MARILRIRIKALEEHERDLGESQCFIEAHISVKTQLVGAGH